LKLEPISPPPAQRDPSPDSVIAVLVTDHRCETVVSICRPTTATAFKVPPDRQTRLFHDGRLYALAKSRLYLLEMDRSSSSSSTAGGSSNPTRIQSMKCVVDKSTCMDDDGSGKPPAHEPFVDKGYLCGYWGYLVISNGRLLYVRRLLGVPPPVPDDSGTRIERACTLWFDLFEAAMDSSGRGRWTRVTTLGGRALFVGTHSRSLPASTSCVTMTGKLLHILFATVACSTWGMGWSRRCCQRHHRLFRRLDLKPLRHGFSLPKLCNPPFCFSEHVCNLCFSVL
jgi:hypothetical protein